MLTSEIIDLADNCRGPATSIIQPALEIEQAVEDARRIGALSVELLPFHGAIEQLQVRGTFARFEPVEFGLPGVDFRNVEIDHCEGEEDGDDKKDRLDASKPRAAHRGSRPIVQLSSPQVAFQRHYFRSAICCAGATTGCATAGDLYSISSPN